MASCARAAWIESISLAHLVNFRESSRGCRPLVRWPPRLVIIEPEPSGQRRWAWLLRAQRGEVFDRHLQVDRRATTSRSHLSAPHDTAWTLH